MNVGVVPSLRHQGVSLVKILLIAAVAFGIVAAMVLAGPSSDRVTAAAAVATVAPGLLPQMTPDAVAEIATSRMDSMASAAGRATGTGRIEQMAAIRYADIALFESRLVPETGEAGEQLVWYVRGSGTWSTQRGRGSKLRVADTGYLIIEDQSGTVVGMGFP